PPSCPLHCAVPMRIINPRLYALQRGKPHGMRVSGRLARADLGAQLLERPPGEARDMNLRDPDLTSDAGLAPAAEEREMQEAPLSLVQCTEAFDQKRSVLPGLIAAVGGTFDGARLAVSVRLLGQRNEFVRAGGEQG